MGYCLSPCRADAGVILAARDDLDEFQCSAEMTRKLRSACLSARRRQVSAVESVREEFADSGCDEAKLALDTVDRLD